jgi:RecA-family ATPase
MLDFPDMTGARIGAAKPMPPALWHSDDEWNEADIPRRPWIARGYILRGACTALAGAGSAGKSSLLKGWGVSLALNQQYGKFTPAGACRVLTYNVEDELNEERMRLSAILRYFGATPADLKGKLRIVGPNDIGTLVERDAATGRLRTMPAMEALEEMIEEFKPDVLMLDPLVELHTAEENDNTGLRSVIAHFGTLAKRHTIGLVIAHHTRKGNTPVIRMRSAALGQSSAQSGSP